MSHFQSRFIYFFITFLHRFMVFIWLNCYEFNERLDFGKIMQNLHTRGYMNTQRERLDVDILIVGGGPAGFGAALRLGQLLSQDFEPGSEDFPFILLIEKGNQAGSHIRSGALLDPVALKELFPDFEQRAPLEQKIEHEEFLFLTEKKAWKIPSFLIPPEMKNHGFYSISLSKFARWFQEEAEQLGIMVFPETSAIEPIIENDRVVGIVTGPKGLDKHGNPLPNFDPGTEIYAKLVILAEGARGTVSDALIQKYGLDRDRQPMIFSSAVKEVIEVPEKTYPSGLVLTSMGYPAPSGLFGGAFFYDMKGPYISVGLVYASEWEDPELDLQAELQKWKLHPYIQQFLKNGKVVQFGGCIIPETGYWGIPQLSGPGFLLTGDSAGLVNVPRNKGIHLAMKSGMVAAEVAYECLKEDNFSTERLKTYEERLRSSWAFQELKRVRNTRQAFQRGFISGLFRAGLYQFTGGRLLKDPLPTKHTFRYSSHPKKKVSYSYKTDDQLILAKTTAVARGAPTYHEQPSHITLKDSEKCVECYEKFKSPCTKFCPADVYRWEPAENRIIVSFENCLHPKICLVACPYDNIVWKPPQGGDGPRFTMM